LGRIDTYRTITNFIKIRNLALLLIVSCEVVSQHISNKNPTLLVPHFIDGILDRRLPQ